jgi:hypothetical protein
MSELSTSIHAFDAPEARESSSKEFVETTWEYPREATIAQLCHGVGTLPMKRTSFK